ncbi:hypothetical protein [Nannocystis pusilla]|nr:hypothetical protein [Nannocystis pusilla]
MSRPDGAEGHHDLGRGGTSVVLAAALLGVGVGVRADDKTCP